MTDVMAVQLVNERSLRLNALAAVLAEGMANMVLMKQALGEADLQPTSRAFSLAATAAVMVLLAHDIGQEVGLDAGLDAARSADATPRRKHGPAISLRKGAAQVACRHCGRLISARQIKKHERACARIPGKEL